MGLHSWDLNTMGFEQVAITMHDIVSPKLAILTSNTWKN